MRCFKRLSGIVGVLIALLAMGCGGGGGGSETGTTLPSGSSSSGSSSSTSSTSSTSSSSSGGGATINTFDVPGSQPTKLAVDGSNNVWVINSESDTVTKFNSSGTVLGTYPVVDAPDDIAIDNKNDIWVASINGLTVLENSGAQLASNSSATFWGITADTAGNIVSYNTVDDAYPDPDLARVSSMNATTGAIESSFDAWVISGNSMWNFNDLLIDADNNYWLIDSGEIDKFDQKGTRVATHIDSGISTNLSYATDSLGNIWYLKNSSMTKLNSSGAPILNIPFNPSQVWFPMTIAVDGDDNVWVGCFARSYRPDGAIDYIFYDNILEYDTNGTLLSSYQQFNNATQETLGGQYPSISGIAIDGSGNVWVSHAALNKISKIVGVAAPVNTPYQPGH